MKKSRTDAPKRGFMGPLGDDIPSIFPIVAGILIFFTSLIYIYQQVEERDAYLNLRSATLQASYIVTENGLMTEAQFSQKCDFELKPFVASKGMEYVVILKRYCGPVTYKEEENFKVRERDIYYGTERIPGIKDSICSSNETIEAIAASSNPKAVVLPSRNTIIMSYPIAVECGSALRGLGTVTIAGWKTGR